MSSVLPSQSTAGHSPSPPPPPPPPRLAIIDFNQLTRGGLEAATGRTRRRRRPRTRPRHRSASANLLATGRPGTVPAHRQRRGVTASRATHSDASASDEK
ncbi:uncharacterized protein LOC126298040 [Schistocerca gregaria]|uniref:uncharacterized protein LOC126298040 n=1 Tax=Schistocerca gregaria TaxID=7010 RepID=UPI00211DF586|nr:uncharacterized protein LOC126298040 [Schistocerca gregaria]